jgi:tetratricopeptide (TPR) repeat protein
MAKPATKKNSATLWSELSMPVLILAAFMLGAGGMWVIMRTSSSAPSAKPAVKPLVPTSASVEPPDVSQLAPAEAARTLADWNYDRQNWQHAIDHYQQAIQAGADNPDVRTDLGNCFRFLGQPQQALDQYQIAQKQNPMHENSLFNQAGLFAELLHDNDRALSIAREFIARFPQSPRADAARQLIAQLEARNKNQP